VACKGPWREYETRRSATEPLVFGIFNLILNLQFGKRPVGLCGNKRDTQNCAIFEFLNLFMVFPLEFIEFSLEIL